MKDIEEVHKIKAVAEYILQQMDIAVDYIHLFKVMYFAQEEHQAIYGAPIMYDTFVARKHGPIPSLSYKVLRVAEGKTMDVTDELHSFATDLSLADSDGHQVVMLAESVQCDKDELSRSNVRILDKWIELCKDIHRSTCRRCRMTRLGRKQCARLNVRGRTRRSRCTTWRPQEEPARIC